MRNTTVTGANSTDWYPINFYDTREGEMRDNPQAADSCAVNGIMNVVDLDVGNLARWLNSGIPGHGANVDYATQNGYVLYFSDHRGMLVDPNASNGGQTAAGVISGESGLEDVVNSGANLTSTTPDGVPEPATYYTYSPEDVDQNNALDNWGARNIGYGFGLNTNTGAPLNPYVRNNSCSTQGAANMVTGARHGLRLIDGGMSAGVSYLPVKPAASACTQNAANPTGCGGFTVVSENPVYVYGNYNSDGSDPFWGTANNANPAANHALSSCDHCRLGDRVVEPVVRRQQPAQQHFSGQPQGHGSGLLPGRDFRGQEHSVPATDVGRREPGLRHRWGFTQLSALSGAVGHNAELRRLAGEHVLLRVQHRHI